MALLLVILYRRKSNSHNRQLRYLKNQINTIEIKVAQECKEAFHELQTNINALAGSMPQGTSFIPFLTYSDYASRVNFIKFLNIVKIFFVDFVSTFIF